MNKAIVVKNISKKYRLFQNSRDRMLDLFVPNKFGEDFYALANINFIAEKGEIIGFIGVNGSGKSTLSNIISGIVPETSGTVEVNGQTALIAVAAGLKNELSGRDNIELKLLMLGFNKYEIQQLEPEIIEFSELGKFIDQPVKSYSSGMKSRLGFAISVSINPDILIIDEALSVGDKAFAEKSLAKMQEFKNKGKTMIFVSHSIGQMREFCNKILWLENGMVKEFGDVDVVIPKYEYFLNIWKLMTDEQREAYRNESLKYQTEIMQGNLSHYHLEIDDFYESSDNDNYIERPVSVLAHIRGGRSFIYGSPKNLNSKIDSSPYKNSVYFAKKQVNYKNEQYYLLSRLPSSIDGIIGWMNVKDLSAHRHVLVDEDKKEFKVKDKVNAYTLPWGGKNNLVFDDLFELSNKDFSVIETNLVGNNVWYKGKLDGCECWLHENNLNMMEENNNDQ